MNVEQSNNEEILSENISTNENSDIIPSKNKPLKEFILILIELLVISFVVSIISHTIFFNAVIPSESMEPTIMTGDRLMGNRLAYKFSDPERFDIVIFDAPDKPSGVYYIKRIIGLPGDTVYIKDGVIYINGEKAKDTYATEEWGKDEEFTFEVPENSYFLMGDNRNNSYDGRYWNNHFIARDKIKAKAIFRYWPITEISKLH